MSKSLQKTSSTQDIDQFLQQVKSVSVRDNTAAGRLIFALDATASRQATWDHACQLQSEIFLAAKDLGGLDVQLCYYRGFGEFKSTAWLSQSNQLLKTMQAVTCLGGHTQIEKVLQQSIKETRQHLVKAVILIVDCCEENADRLCQLAGELGLLNTPVFIFQEGNDTQARSLFQQICTLSGGAYAPFDHHSADLLKELLSAVAVYASGGHQALEQFASGKSRQILAITQQLKR